MTMHTNVGLCAFLFSGLPAAKTARSANKDAIKA